MLKQVMIIRHAEKPGGEGEPRGVTADGEHDPESLTVRGWQRAGALVPFFCDSPQSPIETPDIVFASNPRKGSKRPTQTVTPLIEKLGSQRMNNDFTKGEETDLVEAVRKTDGIVLISWQHERIRDIADALISNDPKPAAIPAEWPPERFDMVWVFTPDADNRTHYRFSQISQLLLKGDRAEILR